MQRSYGRATTPTNELRVKGTFRPERHAEAERTETRNVGVPDKPFGFKAEYEPYWSEAVVVLLRLGILTIDHGPALMAYANACYQLDYMERAIQETGLYTLDDKSGRVMANPLVATRVRLDERKRAWMAELGLTPGMWARVMRTTAKEKESTADPFAAFDVLPASGRVS